LPVSVYNTHIVEQGPMISSNIPSPRHAADFSSRSYWENRFTTETSFEWLQPSSSIIPAVEMEILKKDIPSPAILHLGCGTSDLSNHLRKLLSRLNRPLQRDPRMESVILNVDFAAGAIETSRQHERAEFGDEQMRWAVLDTLDRKAFEQCCLDNCPRLFDVLVEKSYSDALACGEEIPLQSSTINPDPLPDVSVETQSAIQSTVMTPEAASAIYLASVTKAGGLWIAVSYSSERFDFLKNSCSPAASFWSIESARTLLVSDDDSNDTRAGPVHRPQIAHYLYILKRTEVI
ncbi:hypothetical protein M422DRAFT_31569, partial [Sphaerobolus stellatus SS14]